MTDPDSTSVLVVEDERIVALDLQHTLVDLGYEVIGIAHSGNTAIALASKRCPDVVLMDIRIEGDVDGIETAELLRSRFDVPVVYITAHSDDATLERAKRGAPHGYLVKPIRPAVLRTVLEVCVYRHRMEKRQRERERWHSTTLESLADAVVSVDLAGKITFMNHCAEALTGTQADDALGRPAQEVLHLSDPTLPSEWDFALERVLREHRASGQQDAGLKNVATGARHLITQSVAPVLSGDSPIGAVMVFRDVTEERKLQKQLELSNHLASLGTMAAGVAREINNPLSAVTANAEIVERELVSLAERLRENAGPHSAAHFIEEISQSVADIREAGQRIAKIVMDLRAFSRPHLSAHATTLAGVDVRRCIEWAARTTSHEFLQRATLNLQLTDVPPARADDTRLGQVLVNLLVNAAHAISPGDAEGNEVRVSTDTDARGRVVISVRDTGSGIAPALQAKIFDPFFTTKAPQLGTGLGLSVCHGLVRALGGELTFTSTPGRGSCFVISLAPARPDKEPAATATSAAMRSLRGNLLLIDDDAMVLRLLGRALSTHELAYARSGEEALTLLERYPPFDLIVCDLAMARMNGAQFYEAVLVRNPRLARRIVFISGGAISQSLTDFLRTVPNARLNKPFALDELNNQVERLLSRAQRARAN